VQELIDAYDAGDTKRVIAALNKIDFDLRKNEVYKKWEVATRTLLMWATIYGQHDLMRECLRSKESDVNEKDEDGSAAIHFVRAINEKCTQFESVEDSQLKAIDILLENGVDVNV